MKRLQRGVIQNDSVNGCFDRMKDDEKRFKKRAHRLPAHVKNFSFEMDNTSWQAEINPEGKKYFILCTCESQ